MLEFLGKAALVYAFIGLGMALYRLTSKVWMESFHEVLGKKDKSALFWISVVAIFVFAWPTFLLPYNPENDE